MKNTTKGYNDCLQDAVNLKGRLERCDGFIIPRTMALWFWFDELWYAALLGVCRICTREHSHVHDCAHVNIVHISYIHPIGLKVKQKVYYVHVGIHLER